MSSTSSSSSSSSSSAIPTPTPTTYDAVAPADIPGPSTRRTAVAAASQRQRQRRPMNEALPEPFLEALATQLAIDTADTNGRLAVAPALASFFQVCSMWRRSSRSELLWQRLTTRIWRRTQRLRATWQLEFIYWHRTTKNFSTGSYTFFEPPLDPSDPQQQRGHEQLCRCVVLSENHVACGFVDGSVRLFDIETHAHVLTFLSLNNHFFGSFSHSVSGIVMVNNSSISFARLDGDIYVDNVNGHGPGHGPIHARRAVEGDVVNNGVMAGFVGTGMWWVGLYAGVAGQAFQVWDAINEVRVYVGGSVTEPETVMGWHMLTELIEPVGRLRVTEGELIVACTPSMLVCFNLRSPGPGVMLWEERSNTGFMVTSMDASAEAFVVVERHGVGTVRRGSTWAVLSRFPIRVRGGLRACINLAYVLTYSPSAPVPALRVWYIEPQNQNAIAQLCISLGVAGGGLINGMVVNDRHLAISYIDNTINLLDFGVQDL